jgi:hypothetical protein
VVIRLSLEDVAEDDDRLLDRLLSELAFSSCAAFCGSADSTPSTASGSGRPCVPIAASRSVD